MNFIQTAHAASRLQDETQSGLAQFMADLFTAIPLWIAAGIVFFASFFLASFIKKIVVFRMTTRKHDINQEVVILVERVVYFAVVILGATIAFQIAGVNIATLLGFLGFGIGFAFKDLLANFIAGVVILTQKKFKIGDMVRINDIMGKVTEIETRTTQVQDFDGTVHVIPNADMLTSVVQNYSVNSFRRISFEVGVHYATPLKEAIELTLDLVKKHPQIVRDPEPQVLATVFGDSAITLEIRFWVEIDTNWFQVRSELIQAIKLAYDKAGIEIPFPIRTLTLDSHDDGIMKMVR